MKEFLQEIILDANFEAKKEKKMMERKESAAGGGNGNAGKNGVGRSKPRAGDSKISLWQPIHSRQQQNNRGNLSI